jgi:integrase
MVEQKLAYETSEATLSRIETIWRKSLKPFWSEIHPSKIDQYLITTFINWHKQHRPGIQLVNVFKYLGNVFNVIIENGAMELSRRPKLELPKDEQKHHAKQKGRYITDEEFNAILEHSSGWFKTFLLIAYTTGMRKMEIGKMEIDRIELINDRYILSLNTDNTKTGRARKIPLAGILTPLIAEQVKNNKKYLFEKNENHVLPQTIDYSWKMAKKKAGIVGKMREHDLRHSAASNMAKSGISPIMATTLLGMSLGMYQKTYLKLSPDDLIAASESATSRIRN